VPLTQKHVMCSGFVRVSDGTRTRDRLDHNQELYLLSYAHRGSPNLPSGLAARRYSELSAHLLEEPRWAGRSLGVELRPAEGAAGREGADALAAAWADVWSTEAHATD
jgi:hypothetical protein